MSNPICSNYNYFLSPQNHLKSLNLRNSLNLNYFFAKIYQIKDNLIRILTRSQLHMFRRCSGDEI